MKSSFQAPISIDEAMKSIQGKKYLLPIFHRSFVWKDEKVAQFLDSVMRGYPLGSFIFWQVEDESTLKFYDFSEYPSLIFNTKNHKDFYAILDGVQRLISLYIALFKELDGCHIYLNLTRKKENFEYEFYWLHKSDTRTEPIYTDDEGQKWLKCSDIYEFTKEQICKKYDLNKEEQEVLNLFYQRIYKDKLINFYVLRDISRDAAYEIFVRTNSFGECVKRNVIDYDFFAMSLKLVSRISKDFNFVIDEDLILKGILYLFRTDIDLRKIDNKLLEFAKQNWQGISECFIASFKLLKDLKINQKLLLPTDAILPVLFFIYHKNLANSIETQEKNKKLIKQWLLRAIFFGIFEGNKQAMLTTVRKAFLTQKADLDIIDEKSINENPDFPLKEIEKIAKYAQNFNSECDKIIRSGPSRNRYFALLSIIFFNSDREKKDLEVDHLHPKSALQNSKFEYQWQINALPNYQLLEKRKNIAKADMQLKDWVEKCVKEDYKGSKKFFKDNLIPDDNPDLLLPENYDEFCEARKKLLLKRIKEVLDF